MNDDALTYDELNPEADVVKDKVKLKEHFAIIRQEKKRKLFLPPLTGAAPTRQELDALMKRVLPEHQYKLVTLLYSPDGPNDETVCFKRAGYQNEYRQKPHFLRYWNHWNEMQRIFKKLESAGITRSVLVEVLCGPSDQKALTAHGEVLDCEDNKAKIKAVELHYRKRGWIEGPGKNVTVNNQVNVAVQSNVLNNLDAILGKD